MKCIGWPVGVLLLLAAPARGQLVVPGYRAGFEVGFARFGRHPGFPFAPGWVGNPYCGPFHAPFRTSITRVQFIAPAVIIPPPVIVQAPPIVLQPGAIEDDVLNPPPRELPPIERVVPGREPEERPLPGREAGRFRPLEPDNRERARQPFRDEPPPEKPGAGEPPDRPPPRLPRGPAAEPEPKAEAARQTALGREAFAREEYGRAAERFRRASALAADEALPHFLLAQAHVALGNYRRAFDAVQAGLRLQPGWPGEPFRPLELYGDNPAAYPAHLAALGDTLAENPDDAVLLFLYGYLLWFDGRRAEARPLFERAAPALPDPGVVERFLRALPGGPVV